MSNSLRRKISESKAAARIHERGALDAGEIFFQNGVLVQATLPHSNPGSIVAYERSNGAASLYIQPGVEKVAGKWRSVGYPYGSYPRLVLLWMATEVIREGSRRVTFGDSLSGFMRELGLIPSGGRWGSITRLRDQMKRLFSAKIGIQYNDAGGFVHDAALLASHVELWWEPSKPDQAALWDSHVMLTEDFYQAMLHQPVPGDMRVLREIKQSALALDLYCWLTYRVSRLEEPLTLSWQQVHDQFGADYKNAKSFAQQARKELTRLSKLWQGLRYETPRGRLRLYPGEPHVPQLRS